MADQENGIGCDNSAVGRALAYPYPRPDGSYFYQHGTTNTFLDGEYDDGLTMVLAIGSNGAPCQLLRKFGPLEETAIPVMSVDVEGLEVVYAALLSSYGSVPATVCKSEGTRIKAHATLLSDTRLRRMHETEGGYMFCRLKRGHGVRVFFEGKEVLRDIYGYVAECGELKVDGEVFSVKEMPGCGRRHKSLTQREVQTMVAADVMKWDESVEEFIAKNVREKGRRTAVGGKMECSSHKTEDCWEIVTVV